MSEKFVGTWSLKENINFDEYMKKLGHGWVVRQIGKLLKFKLIITINADHWKWENFFPMMKPLSREYDLGVEFEEPKVGEAGCLRVVARFENGHLLEVKHDPSNVKTIHVDSYIDENDRLIMNLPIRFPTKTEWKIKRSMLWHDLDIFDQIGRKIFTADSPAISWYPKYAFKDMRRNGEEVGRVEQIFTWVLPTYEIYRNNSLYAKMEQKFTWFYSEFTVKFDNTNKESIEIESDFWGHNLEFKRNNKLIAKLYKHWFAWTNTYDLSIEPEEDVVLILSCCAVIDRLSDRKESSSNSRSSTKSGGKGR